MGDDLAASVRRWLNAGGIPLEYAAAQTMAKVGFDVAPGRSYQAVNSVGTTAYREVDVLGTLAHSSGRAGVAVVVECKHTTDKPWLVLTNRRPLEPLEIFASVVASDIVRGSFRRAFLRSQGRGMPDFFATIDRPGFSAVVALADVRDDRNPARDAMAQAVGAARGVVATSSGAYWGAAWPVVLIDGRLFEVDYAEDGSDQLEEIEWKRVLWYASPYGEPVAVDIVTSRDFHRYALAAIAGMRGALTRMDEDHEEYFSDANRDEYGHPKPLE